MLWEENKVIALGAIPSSIQMRTPLIGHNNLIYLYGISWSNRLYLQDIRNVNSLQQYIYIYIASKLLLKYLEFIATNFFIASNLLL